MQLRVLGAHNFESRDTRMASYLVDGVMALDAGSLTRALTFEEQKQVRGIILSHRHFDHIRDLLPLGLVVLNAGVTVDVYGIKDTIDFVLSNLLDTRICPDFTKEPTPDKPAFRFHVVDFYEEVKVLGYDAMAVPVPHSVPAAGFQVSSGGLKLFYTGDVGRGLSGVWEHVSPDVLLVEVTYGNDNQAAADDFGHLTPALLAESLNDFEAKLGYLPEVVVSHINPPWEGAVRTELKELSRQLGIEIKVAESDMTMRLGGARGPSKMAR